MGNGFPSFAFIANSFLHELQTMLFNVENKLVSNSITFLQLGHFNFMSSIFIFIYLSSGNINIKLCAFAEFACCGDLSFVVVNNFFYDGKPDACSCVFVFAMQLLK